mmetsp:Transcript_22919/g.33284  ORF Transcript_22919/g.33284 Transcript_22919/m.33284 type:complete len:266 (+) Transcript_22919:73-870(+)
MGRLVYSVYLITIFATITSTSSRLHSAFAFTQNVHTVTRSLSTHLHPQYNTHLHAFSSDPLKNVFDSFTASLTSFPLSLGFSPGFRRIPTQFIAAVGDPNAKSGENAQEWGLWELDPGPRGVFLQDYERLKRNGGITPSGWKLDEGDWWLDENGIIMEQPIYPLPAGQYLVTGGRQVTSVLTVRPPSEKEFGQQRWSLSGGAKLYDVTHLPCRAARYRPNGFGGSPATAYVDDFPLSPGAIMPEVSGCVKQQYPVLLVVGIKDKK